MFAEKIQSSTLAELLQQTGCPELGTAQPQFVFSLF